MWLDEMMKTKQDLKTKFSKEIDILKRIQAEMKKKIFEL